MEKLRDYPISVREMFDWRMISYKTFSEIKDMDFEDALLYCRNIGYMMKCYDEKHFINYVKENNIKFDNKKHFFKILLWASNGACNPAILEKVWVYFNG